jgi:hypothetical protein
MVCFQTKNPNLGQFWRVLKWRILEHFRTILSILRPLEIFYGQFVYICGHLVYFPRFGILYQEKSGNPAWDGFCIIYPRTVWMKYSTFFYVLQKTLCLHSLAQWRHEKLQSGANPTIVSCNASVVIFSNATGSLARLENKNILLYFEKRYSLLHLESILRS